MISTAHLFLTVEDILHQRLYEAADLLDIVRYRPLLDAQLVRHFLLRGSVIEQAENPTVLRLDLGQHGDEVFQDRLIDNVILKRSFSGRLRSFVHQERKRCGLVPLAAHLRSPLTILAAVAFRAADQSAVLALYHAPSVPILTLDLSPDRLHVRLVLRLRGIDHHDAALAVSDTPPGDILRLDPEITDDLICYHHWYLELL